MDLTRHVVAVHASAAHTFSKYAQRSIQLLRDSGVEGDAHCGTSVRHRSRVAREPSSPNLRQVHLIESELFEDLARERHVVRPGDLGENVTTAGIDLRSLPAGTLMDIGEQAQIRLTGLRTPCGQIDSFQPGLRKQVTTRDDTGNPSLRGGAMAVVSRSGLVTQGDAITVVLPDGPHASLTRV